MRPILWQQQGPTLLLPLEQRYPVGLRLPRASVTGQRTAAARISEALLLSRPELAVAVLVVAAAFVAVEIVAVAFVVAFDAVAYRRESPLEEQRPSTGAPSERSPMAT